MGSIFHQDFCLRIVTCEFPWSLFCLGAEHTVRNIPGHFIVLQKLSLSEFAAPLYFMNVGGLVNVDRLDLKVVFLAVGFGFRAMVVELRLHGVPGSQRWL